MDEKIRAKLAQYDLSSPRWDDDYAGERLERLAVYLCAILPSLARDYLERWKTMPPHERKYWRDEARTALNFMNSGVDPCS